MFQTRSNKMETEARFAVLKIPKNCPRLWVFLSRGGGSYDRQQSRQRRCSPTDIDRSLAISSPFHLSWRQRFRCKDAARKRATMGRKANGYLLPVQRLFGWGDTWYPTLPSLPHMVVSVTSGGGGHMFKCLKSWNEKTKSCGSYTRF